MYGFERKDKRYENIPKSVFTVQMKDTLRIADQILPLLRNREKNVRSLLLLFQMVTELEIPRP